MGLFKVDSEKCKKDGICVNECPMKIIRTNAEGIPEPVEGADESCISCFHCVAVCPHEAFTLGSVTPESCKSVNGPDLPSSDQAEMFMLSRRSTRAFRTQPVEKDRIEKCIDIARHAPTGHNSQPVHWTILYDADVVHKMCGLVIDWMKMMIDVRPEMAGPLHFDRVTAAWAAGINVVTRDAPHIVIAHADRSLLPAQSACTIALTHFELAAHSLGIGATWGGFFHAAAATFPPLKQELKLPETHQPFGAMLVGYNKHRYYRVPTRKDAPVTWQ